MVTAVMDSGYVADVTMCSGFVWIVYLGRSLGTSTLKEINGNIVEIFK